MNPLEYPLEEIRSITERKAKQFCRIEASSVTLPKGISIIKSYIIKSSLVCPQMDNWATRPFHLLNNRAQFRNELLTFIDPRTMAGVIKPDDLLMRRFQYGHIIFDQ